MMWNLAGAGRLTGTAAQVFARKATERTVCEMCGLARMGHGPESRWLGWPKHGFAPIAADDAMLASAAAMTRLAYSFRI